MNILVVDTDIIIDVGRYIQVAIDRLDEENKNSILCISSVTQMELIIGCLNKTELLHLHKFLKRFEIIDLKSSISKKAIELLYNYRLSHGLLIADSLIASTALVLDADFLTKNQKDYRFIEGIKLKKYP